jgi:hypothetical protein
MSDQPRELDGVPKTEVRKMLSVVKPTRREQLKQVAEVWLLEEEYSKYRYDVEICKDGRRVYLTRPTNLNKGFDFEIKLEGFVSLISKRRSERPSHKDVMADLEEKKKESSVEFRKLRELIDGIYGCDEPDEILTKYPTLMFKVGLPVDALLKVLKWMFIEQDLTYWNWSGRRMLMGEIRGLD